MYRSKPFRAIALLAGMAALMYLIMSMFLPSSRRLIVGVNKSNGRVRIVGNHLTLLPPHEFYRLSFEKRDGSAQRDGLIQILSKENVPVTINYRLRFSIVGDRLEDARTLVRSGWNGWIRARVAEAVSAVARQVPIEELLSPTSQFATRRDVLRNIVAAHLARAGLKVTAFEISRIEADHKALLETKRAELRRSARGTVGRVAIFAIDGADWDLLTELGYDDRIPNLQALMRNGAIGSLQTIQPTVSPLVWTSLATGVTPDRHGMIDFIDRSKNAPMDARRLRAPALWNIAEAFGRHAMVVNWWSDWPPQSTSATVFDTPVQLVHGATYPEAIASRARQHEVPVETIGYAHVRRFLNITQQEYDEAVKSGNPSDPINVFRNVLAKTWSDHRVAMDLYQQQLPTVTMVGYDGTDVVNHLFAPYHPPYREGIGQVAYRRYWPAVANYYAEIDRLLGEWMQVLTDDTTVIVVSAHGFRWGENRPRLSPAGRASISDHRNPGVFIAYGSHVAPSRVGHAISIYDIVPTALAILGLPKAVEMPGQPATWLLRDVTPVESVRIVSYSEFFDRAVGGVPTLDAKQYIQALQAIGHLIDPSRPLTPVFEEQEASRPIPPEQWGAYAHLNNTAIELRKQGKLQESTDAFQKAIELNPTRPIPYLNMAMVMLDRQQYSVADDLFMAAVSRNMPNAEQWFIDFGAYYRDHNMPSRAISLLYRGRQIFPQSYAIAANLGSALSEMNRYGEGLPELERALSLQPSSTLALNNLGTFYAKRNDYSRALDFWNRSLTIDAAQPQVRAAVSAARTRL
ncbi:MAG TPA: alkaline phosphatase family protein [Thermoanaerobaculia bacterium]|nr:alkaline phosphatase family protein [Thermoanaerobaculia bacterium]